MLRRTTRGRNAAPPPKDFAAAHALAVGLLARRDLCGSELRARLLGRGCDASTAEAVIGALTAQGAVNEARYAHNYVTWHARRGQGPVRIAAELARQGVPPELIETALREGPDWQELAARVRATRFGRQAPASWGEKARQARFLQYRGFSADHIRAATGAASDPGCSI